MLPPPPAEVFFAFFILLSAWVPIYCLRSNMDLGQIVYGYLCGIVLAISWLINIYQMPDTGRLVVRPFWNPPMYQDPRDKQLFQQLDQKAIIDQVRDQGIQISDDVFTQRRLACPMVYGYTRMMLVAVGTLLAAGWRFTPGWIERVVYRRPRPMIKDTGRTRTMMIG